MVAIGAGGGGTQWKTPVVAATAGPLPANTLTGSTLTATANGALVVDGVSPPQGARLLVANEAAAANNGLYLVVSAGSPSTKWQLGRAGDMTTGVQVPGAVVLVESGTANAGSLFMIPSSASYTIGATPITWSVWRVPAAPILWPSGDTTGATDQALITAAENAGKNIYFGIGTFIVAGLTKQSNSEWTGAGPGFTTIQLANGANADVIQSASFATLTLSGANSAGSGIHDFAIRDLTVNGNKASQSGTSYGIRIYGYTFELRNLHITGCLTDGLYTEWGTGVAPSDATEAMFADLKIYGNGVNGWHQRGPHDSRSYNVTIFNNGSGSSGSLLGPAGYWSEDCSGSIAITVAAGSNGVSVSTFAGAGTLNVNTTIGYPQASISATQGSLTVATSGVTAVITYTGVTATSFTGCTTISGSGTLSTGGSVTATGGGYTGNGMLSTAFHVWQSNPQPNYSAILDAQSSDFVLAYFEKGTTGAVLVRGPNCILGECHMPLAGSVGSQCGLQMGDTANVCFGLRYTGDISGYGNSSQATSSINIVNDGGNNDIDVRVQSSGSNTTVIGGSPGTQSRYRVQAVGMSVTNSAAAGLDQATGRFFRNLPSASSGAFTLHEQGTDLWNISTSASPQARQYPNGLQDIFYTDAYTTPFWMVDGPKAHLVAKSGSAGSLNPTVAAGAEASAASLVSTHSSDTAGTVQATMVASPGAGAILTVTFKNAFSNNPNVSITPTNSIAAQCTTYINASTTGFTIFLATTPPAAVDSQVASWSYRVMGLDA